MNHDVLGRSALKSGGVLLIVKIFIQFPSNSLHACFGTTIHNRLERWSSETIVVDGR